MELKKAHAIASRVVDRSRAACSRVEIAGSIRREKPDVKDIEVVAIVDDYDAFYKRLSALGKFIKPGVSEIIEWPPKPNAKYVRMLLNEGIKLDLFIANPDNWGGLFCMRTGSGVGPDGNPFSGFVPRMFKQWKVVSGGGRMSGCQPTMPDGLQLSVPEEIDFFDLCGVEWVEPNCRLDSKAVRIKK